MLGQSRSLAEKTKAGFINLKRLGLLRVGALFTRTLQQVLSKNQDGRICPLDSFRLDFGEKVEIGARTLYRKRGRIFIR